MVVYAIEICPVISVLKETQTLSKRTWFTYLRQRRFQFLVLTQLSFVFLAPLMGQDLMGRSFTAIFASLSFVQGCLSIIRRKRVFLTVGAAAFLLSSLGSFTLVADFPPFSELHLQAATRLVSIAFYLVAAIIIFRDVIAPGDVDHNKLCGAVCLYISIGILWGQFYQLAEIMDPNSFYMDLAKLEKHGVIGRFEQANLLNYFSFVTLSTLGYGDISPVSRITRTLAWSEALLGQIYLAILVSRLVGLHLASSGTSSTEE